MAVYGFAEASLADRQSRTLSQAVGPDARQVRGALPSSGLGSAGAGNGGVRGGFRRSGERDRGPSSELRQGIEENALRELLASGQHRVGGDVAHLLRRWWRYGHRLALCDAECFD